MSHGGGFCSDAEPSAKPELAHISSEFPNSEHGETGPARLQAYSHHLNQIGKPQIEDTDDTRFLRIAKVAARTPPTDVNSETYNCLASEGVLDYYSTVLLLSG